MNTNTHTGRMGKLPCLLLVAMAVVALPDPVRGEAYFETLYEMMVDAKDTLKEVAGHVNHGLETVAKTVKFVESFIDSTVEEDCVYRCHKNKVPIGNPSYVPQANGCGSLGVFFEREDLPRPEMVDCCNDHDVCYDTCGSDKEDCDRKFKRCLYSICDVNRKDMNFVNEKKCKGGAKMLYMATMALGCTAYKDSQRESCLCVDVKDIPEARNEL